MCRSVFAQDYPHRCAVNVLEARDGEIVFGGAHSLPPSIARAMVSQAKRLIIR